MLHRPGDLGGQQGRIRHLTTPLCHGFRAPLVHPTQCWGPQQQNESTDDKDTF